MFRVKPSKILIFVASGISAVVCILITISNALPTWGVARSKNVWSNVQFTLRHDRFTAVEVPLTAGVWKVCDGDNCTSLWKFKSKLIRHEALNEHIIMAQIFLTTAGIISVFTALILIICGLLGIVHVALLNVGKTAVCLVFLAAIIGMASGINIVSKLNQGLRDVLVDDMQLGAAAILVIVATVLALIGIIVTQFVSRQYP